MTSISETLVAELEKRGVDTVFGIPGVHTVELYRGLADSNIRHITPRHEQGAGFMADGYARVSAKPGVAFVITGPGLTNTLTAMGQARADSVPMLVVSGVNKLDSLGKGLGHLHELPDQQAMTKTVALVSERVEKPDDLLPALNAAFAPFHAGRPGPTHIEIPLDIAGLDLKLDDYSVPKPSDRTPDKNQISKAIEILKSAKSPVILVGGGARFAADALRNLAEKLDAPVVQTVNARGVIFDHALGVPASPSLTSVRELIEAADVVLALGTEIGKTDYDMYGTGTMPTFQRLIRVDLCADQLARQKTELPIRAGAAEAIDALIKGLSSQQSDRSGAARAKATREAAFAEIGPEYQALTNMLNAARDSIPKALMVGDSAQPIYAGNLYYDHDRPGGWFNAATGFGALGYGIPAAIGAALADSSRPVICICGDGGAQFSLPEIMTAVDEKLPIIFVIWNNFGYQEIATSMQNAGVTVVGCDPTPPNFKATAQSFGIPYSRCDLNADAFAELLKAAPRTGPSMIEVRVPNLSHAK